MGRGQTLRTTLRSWRVAAALAAGSLLPTFPWRVVTDLAGWLGGIVDVLGTGVIVGLPVVGAPTVGLVLAWLLIGHLTYRYTHLLYPAEYEAVADHDGFRVLTALGTLYFGVVVWGSRIPEAVPLQVLTLPASWGAGIFLTLMLSGIIGGGLLFGVYLTRWHPEELSIGEREIPLLTSYRDDDDEWRSLPGRWQSFYRWQWTAANSMLPLAICAIIGLAAVVVNAFYPIPEAAFLVGLVALRVWPETESNPVDVSQHEIDVRLLDVVSGATRNLKGFFMVSFSFLGMMFSGLWFFYSVSGLVVPLFSSGAADSASSAGPVWLRANAALGVFTSVMLVLALLMIGVYSVLHWVRQLERIEPYARQWDDDSETEDGNGVAPVTRPPGLLLPAHLPIVGLSLGTVAGRATESTLVHLGVNAGSLTAAVVVMGWALVWTRRHRREPQPLTHEPEALLVTLLLHFSIFFTISYIIDDEPLQIYWENVPHVALLLLVISVVYYFPDVVQWASRQEGFRKHLDNVYLVVLAVLVIQFAQFVIEGSTLVFESIVIGLVAFYILVSLIEIYLERIAE